MAEQADWIASLQSMIEKMQATGVAELEVRRGDLRVRLRRDPRLVSAPSQLVRAGEAMDQERPDLHRVTAPLTGVFYRAPNPASKPFVEVGDWVEHDTRVGLIETMKVFNEVTADCRGRVVGFLVEAGKLVYAGDPLLVVDSTAAPDHASEVVS